MTPANTPQWVDYLAFLKAKGDLSEDELQTIVAILLPFKEKILKDMLEMFKLSKNEKCYAFTYCPKKLKGTRSFYKQCQILSWHTALILKKATAFKCVSEARDDNTNSWHCHGIIRIDDKIKWFRSTKGKLSNGGFFKIDKMKTPINWVYYCFKDIYLWLDYSNFKKDKSLLIFDNAVTHIEYVEDEASRCDRLNIPFSALLADD